MSLAMEEFGRRRAALADQLEPGSLVLLPAASIRYRNRDAEYPFRQDSDFLYLCGFPEPDAWLAITVSEAAVQTSLFVLPRDREKEIWNGYRAGPEGALADYGVDHAFNLDQLDEEIPKLIAASRRIYYPLGREPAIEQRIIGWRAGLIPGNREAATLVQELHNLDPLLHELRLVKSPAEQALLRRAAAISAEGHRRAMQRCRPGMAEYQLEAELHYHFTRVGARAPAYGTIVGGGHNGCILHYTENRDPLCDGDLVLIDAGAEWCGYAGDITRTFPVNGRFSEPQRALYQLVLDAQLAAIAAVRPGASFQAPHDAAVAVLTAGLVRLGLLEGEVPALIADEAYRPFYMHRSSHWLGLDVHDVGDYKRDGEWRALVPGMVVTIEPGLYIAPDCEQVAPHWRGIGIRIEDDVLVTAAGCEVLTAAVPKTIDEIEQQMAGS